MRKVVCAANKMGNLMLVGARHWDAVMHKQYDQIDHYLILTNEDVETWQQGFIDQYGVFMTRQESWVVAESAGQIIKRVGGDFNTETQIGKLFSENLY